MMNTPLSKQVEGKSGNRGYNQIYRAKPAPKPAAGRERMLKKSMDENKKKTALSSALSSLSSGASFRNQ
jgi:hypothetical protein